MWVHKSTISWSENFAHEKILQISIKLVYGQYFSTSFLMRHYQVKLKLIYIYFTISLQLLNNM